MMEEKIGIQLLPKEKRFFYAPRLLGVGEDWQRFIYESELALVDGTFFIFYSRSPHTRWPRDWSSDVCSSDLPTDDSPQYRFREAALEMVRRAGRHLHRL